MKSIPNLLYLTVIVLLSSCGNDEDLSASKLNHVGQKWLIKSVNYTIVDQGLSNPANWVQTGTAKDAGAFYFNDKQGSFDIVINNKREEDYFGYTSDGNSISIITVEQSFSPSRFSQSIIAFNGEQGTSTMTISGTFTKQGGLSQYVFTGDFTLERQ